MSTFVFHAPIGSYTLHFSEHEVASFSVLHALIIGRIGSLRRRCVLVKEVQGTSWGVLNLMAVGVYQLGCRGPGIAKDVGYIEFSDSSNTFH